MRRKKKASPPPSGLRDHIVRGVKWLFVAGLWVGIALTLLIAW